MSWYKDHKNSNERPTDSAMYKLTKQGNEITKRRRKRRTKKPKEIGEGQESLVNDNDALDQAETFGEDGERHQADGASEASSAAPPTSQMQIQSPENSMDLKTNEAESSEILIEVYSYRNSLKS